MDKYLFRPYDPLYPTLFALEKAHIQTLLTHLSAIEHIGSTAIPGLGGKGILDIMIGTDKTRLHPTQKTLATHYTFQEKWSTPERFYFNKDYPHKSTTRTVHIHLTEQNSPEWKRLIGFRDYLLHHPKALSTYIKIKKEAVQAALGEGAKYRAYKNQFIQDILVQIPIA